MKKYWKQLVLLLAFLMLFYMQFLPLFQEDVSHSTRHGWHALINLGSSFFDWFFLAVLFSNALFSGISFFGKNEEKRWDHIVDILGCLIVMLGCFYFIPYLLEIFIAWNSGYLFEQIDFFNKTTGQMYLPFLFLNVLIFVLSLFFIAKTWRLNSKYSFWLSVVLFLIYFFESNFERIYIDASNLLR